MAHKTEKIRTLLKDLINKETPKLLQVGSCLKKIIVAKESCFEVGKGDYFNFNIIFIFWYGGGEYKSEWVDVQEGRFKEFIISKSQAILGLVDSTDDVFFETFINETMKFKTRLEYN
jgi:hypothetical protein